MPKIELYDYQLDAVGRTQNGSILCGGVGSGKSRTSLAYYYQQQGGSFADKKSHKMILGGRAVTIWDINLAPMKNPKDLYIITTARKRDTLEWEGEFGPFLITTNEDVAYYKGHKVVVDSWNNIQKYADVKDAFFIFDEQRVVGYGAWSKTFIKIAKSNDWILLSATPGDTWQDYIPVFMANGFYRTKTEFEEEHIIWRWIPHAKYRSVDRYINTGRLIRLRNKILVTMDFERPTISHHEDVYCKYDISMYRDAGRLRWDPYKDEPIEGASGLCAVWRRIVNSDASRQIALLEIFEDHPKLIVFYNYNYERDILKGLFECYDGVEVAEWSGHAHQPIPASDSWVYLVQYTAGAEGWNCITTDTIVFYSQNYSYKIMEQSAGRIDRLNTPYRDLYYYHLKSRSGIDLAISRALHDKKNFNEGRYVERSMSRVA